MLKVTPAHDANDFDIARRVWPNSEMPLIMTEDGRMGGWADGPSDTPAPIEFHRISLVWNTLRSSKEDRQAIRARRSPRQNRAAQALRAPLLSLRYGG